MTLGAQGAGAAQAPVDLGTATSFSVLASSTVTNTGPSIINGNLGVSTGTAVTGFPPGIVLGTTHTGTDGVGAHAKSDMNAAYTTAAGSGPVNNVATELGGTSLPGGVYRSDTLGLTGTLTLDGDASAVWIFQAGSTLITASDSSVKFTGGANACNVFWQIGSSATLGTSTAFAGTVMAHESISANTGATIEGRLFAGTGAVTLDTNVITAPDCETSTPPTDTSSSSGGTGTAAGIPGGGSSTGKNGNGNGNRNGNGSGNANGTTADTSGAHHPLAGTEAALGRSTGIGTHLSTTGSNLTVPLLGGLLATGIGAMLLLAARRTLIAGRHRR